MSHSSSLVFILISSLYVAVVSFHMLLQHVSQAEHPEQQKNWS